MACDRVDKTRDEINPKTLAWLTASRSVCNARIYITLPPRLPLVESC